MGSTSRGTRLWTVLKTLLIAIGVMMIPIGIIAGVISFIFFSVSNQLGDHVPDTGHLVGEALSPSLPKWSPAGEFIVFGYANGLFRVTTDGSQLIPLSKNSSEDPRDISRSPSISSNDSRIAFEAFKHKGTFPWSSEYKWEIVTTTPDTSNRRRLAESLGFDLSPVWSPDGSQIAFISNRLFEGEAYEGIYKIYTMAPDGSNVNRLTQFPGASYISPPVWSPDGQGIAFVSHPNSRTREGRLYATQLHNPELAELSDTVSQPTWSPDSKRIAFLKPDGPTADLYVTQSDGSGTAELLELDVYVGTHFWNVDWAPDGTQLLLSGGSLVIVVNSDGTGMRRLANLSLGHVGLHASWSREASKIAVYAPIGNSDVARGLDAILFTMEPDGSDRRVLARFQPSEEYGGIGTIVAGRGSAFPTGIERPINAAPKHVTPTATPGQIER